ncbi:methyltransferase domain-containing protein [Actinomadura macrotermitis]|uniref:tRNA 5-carboxymethoxyuridine methyltransferase n=1 Tax=Actinomadura macrotermitis TaxID=2585200 RepID=A0A7K0BNP7_9ACTN|nr:methyltransferase domain-containing protein [Actinomadura macrotermitis]MQY02334.1 tRNA 5-carboxymethoxyuridine methyltransferase [Actinomadura macrotermitis]
MSDSEGAAVTAQRGKRIRGSGKVRGAVLWDALRTTLERIGDGPGPRDVVDVGGGTGGFAVPLAGLGHRVTVVDASPDALAALERRAADAGVAVHAVQGDATDLPHLLGPDAADLVLCHSVLEYVDDPAAAMAAMAGVVRPGGSLSLLAAGQVGAVLHRAVAGHFDEARAVLAGPGAGEQERVPRRYYTRESLAALVAGAGLHGRELLGVRIFADLVPAGLLDADADSVESLIALETAAAVHPVLRELATQLHLVADRR